jgi:hypothetical protein
MKTKYFAGILLLAAGLMTFTSCSDDDDYTIATSNILTSVVTGEAKVTAVSATTSATVKDLSSQSSSAYDVGVVFGTNQDPTTSGTKKSGSIDADGTVTTSLTGLTKGVTYYYATYVTLQSSVTKYGDVKSFTTTDVNVATAAASNITAVGATISGTVSADASVISGNENIVYGFKVSDNEANVQNGREYALTGKSTTFSKALTGLTPGQTYYYTTFYQISDGYQYGATKSFTTTSQDAEWVDLGLSVLWAKCNLGASKESEAGGLYGWGDVCGMMTSTYLTDYTPAQDITETTLDPAAVGQIDKFDVGTLFNSKLPTKDQIDELINGTTQEWTTVDGVSGYKLTSKTNGNSIFMPAAGYRIGSEESGANVQGTYWSGSINTIDTDYGYTLNFRSGTFIEGNSKRNVALSIRPVRLNNIVACDNSKIKVGDIENNGNIRIEIYNEYGSTKADPPIKTSAMKFTKNLVVTFNITGIDGNLKSGASTTHWAGLNFADADWAPSYWTKFNDDTYDTKVTGDGTYSVWMSTGGIQAEGAVVFTVDIKNLDTDLIDNSKVKVEIKSIELDQK